MAVTYWTIPDLTRSVTLASVTGERELPNPNTVMKRDEYPPTAARFMDNRLAMNALQTTAKAAETRGSEYGCNFLSGGYGAMCDFDTHLIGDIVTEACAAGVILGAVGHGPSELLPAKETNGDPLVRNKRVNSFTNRETEQMELIGVEPFLLETRLRDAGALFECRDNSASPKVTDSRLITRRDPLSTEAVCRLLKQSLEESRC